MARALLLLAFCAGLHAEYLIGKGIEETTPTAEEIKTAQVWLGGYGEVGDRGGKLGLAQGVHDPVWARAICVDDGKTPLVFMSIDAIGMGNLPLGWIRDNITQQVPELVSDHILVSITHSHSSPDMQGIWGGVSRAYQSRLIQCAVKAAVTAWKTRESAKLYVSQARGFNHNRRDWGWAQNVSTVLDAVSTKDSKRIATLIQFTAHPTVIGSDNYNISSDWIHYLRVRAESKLDAPVVYINGPIGDVSPAPRNGSGWTAAQSYGTDIADIAVNSIDQKDEVTGPIYIDTAHYEQNVTNPLFWLAFELNLLKDTYKGNNLNGRAWIDTRCSVLKFGNLLTAVAFPGESLTRNAEPILESMNTKYKLFLGLNGDTLGYFVPHDEWKQRHGGYEESVSMDEWEGDQVRDRLIGMIKKANTPTIATQ